MTPGKSHLGLFDRLKAAGNLVFKGRSIAAVTKGIDSMGGGFQGVPAYWFARAIEVGGQETLFEPYRNSVWVQRAIKTVAGPVASVPLDFYPANVEVTSQKGIHRARPAFA